MCCVYHCPLLNLPWNLPLYIKKFNSDPDLAALMPRNKEVPDEPINNCLFQKENMFIPKNRRWLCSMWLCADSLWLTHKSLILRVGTTFNLSVSILQARKLISPLHTLKSQTIDQSTLVKDFGIIPRKPGCICRSCHPSFFLVATVSLQLGES